MFKFFVSLLAICGVLRADVVIDNGQADTSTSSIQSISYKKLDLAIEKGMSKGWDKGKSYFGFTKPKSSLTKVAKDAEGVVVQNTAQINIKHKLGTNRQAFDRKLDALQDLAGRGKLIKTNVVRDPRVTEKYRADILNQAKKQWGNDPERMENIRSLLRNTDADHLHELQLGGLDKLSHLVMLDKQVNRSVGVQIRHQIKDLEMGTKITSVIEKVTN